MGSRHEAEAKLAAAPGRAVSGGGSAWGRPGMTMWHQDVSGVSPTRRTNVLSNELTFQGDR